MSYSWMREGKKTMATWTEMMREYECAHDITELRQMVDSMDRIHVVKQCVTCGAHRGSVGKAGFSATAIGALPAFDRDLQERYPHEVRAKVQHRWDSEAYLRRQDYDTYLDSPEWRQLRGLVLARDGHQCQGCLSRRATEVHHLTYAHRGHEFAFELVGLCRTCHERLSLGEQEGVG